MHFLAEHTQCLGVAVPPSGLATKQLLCFSTAKKKKKKRGVFYQESPKVPQVALRFEICLESKALLIIPRALCLSSALWVRGVGI